MGGGGKSGGGRVLANDKMDKESWERERGEGKKKKKHTKRKLDWQASARDAETRILGLTLS